MGGRVWFFFWPTDAMSVLGQLAVTNAPVGNIALVWLVWWVRFGTIPVKFRHVADLHGFLKFESST